MKYIISRDSIVVATQEQVSCDLAGEVVILHLRSGMYYGLDAVGARIWSLIQTPMNVNDLRDALLEEYDVDPDRCERDLVALLEDITAQGLIEVRNATTA